MKSTSGYVEYLTGAPIIWSSKRQTTIATSTTEAEYIGQFNAMKHMVYLDHFLTELSIPHSTPMTLFTDNQSAQATAHNPEFHSRLKHIDIAYHYQRELVEQGRVQLVHIPSAKMTADGLTKPLSKNKFNEFIELLHLNTTAAIENPKNLIQTSTAVIHTANATQQETLFPIFPTGFCRFY